MEPFNKGHASLKGRGEMKKLPGERTNAQAAAGRRLNLHMISLFRSIGPPIRRPLSLSLSLEPLLVVGIVVFAFHARAHICRGPLMRRVCQVGKPIH